MSITEAQIESAVNAIFSKYDKDQNSYLENS